MADLSVELAELNANARELLKKHDRVFTKLEELSTQKQTEIEKIITTKQKEIDTKVQEGLKAIDDILKSGRVAEAENALKLGGKILNQIQVYFTYGRLKTTNRYSNIDIGVDNFSYNYCYIDPPSGYSIDDLVVFMPSISKIYFSGDVNGDDTIYCHWKIDGNRIKVTCNNSENRADAYINFIAGWRKK